MKNFSRILSICAALALILACAVFSVSAAESIIPSSETYTTASVCPHCGKTVSWTPLTTIASTEFITASGHYVVEAGTTLTYTKTTSLGASASDVAILVIGNIDLTSAGQIRFGNTGTHSAWLIGGGGRIQGGNAPETATNPSLLGVYNTGTLNIIGDITIQGNETEAVTANRGGIVNVYGKGVVNMYGGTITGYNLATTNTKSYSGIYLRNGGTFNMYGGTINGGTAQSGAAVYIASGTFTMNGGTVNGGTAANGGTLYMADGKLIMTDGTINGGTARNDGTGSSTGHGGCMYLAGGTATLQGGTVSGGKTVRVKDSGGTYRGGDGGTFYVASTLNLNGVTVNGGTCYRGAVFFVTGSNGKVNMTAGAINSGAASNQGDLAGVYSNGTFNMSGGVAHNSEVGEGSGFRVQSGKVYLHGNAKVEAAAGGRNGFDMISASSTSAILVLAGNACVSDLDGNQTNVHNITFQSYTSGSNTYYPILRIANDWTGYASITDNFGSTVSGEYIMTATSGGTTKYYAQCGTWDASALTFTKGGNYEAGKLIHGGANDGDLPVFGEEGNLMLPRAKAVVDSATSWYRIADQAADAAADSNGYAVLYKDDTNPITIASGKTVCMDFNGFNAIVTGEGTLMGLDSSALTTGTGASVVTLEGVTVKPLAKSPTTGECFVALQDNGTATFHAVTANITTVSVRPGTVGMYYTASFVCDDQVKGYLNSFGLALSLTDMPDENFETDCKTIYTMTEGTKLTSGGYNSVIVQNIMESQLASDINKTRGELPVYANAYMKLTIGGEEVIVMAYKTAEFSLKTMLQEINTYWDTYTASAQENLATQIYDSYVRKFDRDDWSIYNIRIKANGGYTAEEEAILAQRRQTVMDYMRESVSLLWRSDKTFTYSLGNTERDQGKSFTIVEGRLYQGLPYVYAAGTRDAFLEYAAGAPDENGIYTITGVEATALNYESYGGRVGNDCSGAVTNAWSQVSTSVAASTSSGCSPYFGVVPVGNYLFNAPINPSTNRVLDTKVVVETNGQQTMFEAYAMLQPADAAYHQEYPSTKGNHIRMVVSVNVVRNADGTINGASSTITMLEQTRNLTSNNTTTTHPVTGETIYVIGGVNRKFTFNSLFNDHYIPVTIKELRDPTPVEETWVTDSLEEPATIENLFTGNISSNRYTDSVKITIYNESGEIVQQITGRKSRSYSKLFRMTQFANEKPGSFKGELDLEALPAGNYRCTVTLKLTIDSDYVHTVRDFTFSK